MSADDSKDAVERRTDEAFARSGWRDPRAEYRSLLRRLRDEDPARFDRAVAEYEERVIARVAQPETDPVAAWLDYGGRLAEIVGGGKAVAVDAEGRSSDAAGPPTQPVLLLHLPADASAPAIVIAEPRDAAPAQRATVSLLAERRNALPA